MARPGSGAGHDTFVLRQCVTQNVDIRAGRTGLDKVQLTGSHLPRSAGALHQNGGLSRGAARGQQRIWLEGAHRHSVTLRLHHSPAEAGARRSLVRIRPSGTWSRRSRARSSIWHGRAGGRTPPASQSRPRLPRQAQLRTMFIMNNFGVVPVRSLRYLSSSRARRSFAEETLSGAAVQRCHCVSLPPRQEEP